MQWWATKWSLVAIVEWYRRQYPTDSPVEAAQKARINSMLGRHMLSRLMHGEIAV